MIGKLFFGLIKALIRNLLGLKTVVENISQESDVLAEIQTEYLRNTSLQRCCYIVLPPKGPYKHGNKPSALNIGEFLD
jgi:hypothetical protein